MEYYDLEVVNDAKIIVIGCGGAGGNAVNTMIAEDLKYVDFVAINTDSQALAKNNAAIRLQIGEKMRKGLGCGAKPECGKLSAENDEDKIREVLTGHDMAFVTAGFGGGTGTGSAPVVAKIAQEMGILTVAVVTKPFRYEGPRKLRIAELWIEELNKNVDSLIVISNQKLIETASDVSFFEAFKLADRVLMSSVAGIADSITESGFINIDFADVKTILEDSGQALIGVGYGSGETKVLDAVKQAIENPLIEDLTMDGAAGILVNFKIGLDTTQGEIDTAFNYITKSADPEAIIVFGAVLDPELENGAQVTIVATRFTPQVEEIIEIEEIEVLEVKPVVIEKKIVEVIKQEAVKQEEVIKPEEIVEEINEDHKVTKKIRPRPRVKKEEEGYGVVSPERKNDLDVPAWLYKRRKKSKNS